MLVDGVFCCYLVAARAILKKGESSMDARVGEFLIALSLILNAE